MWCSPKFINKLLIPYLFTFHAKSLINKQFYIIFMSSYYSTYYFFMTIIPHISKYFFDDNRNCVEWKTNLDKGSALTSPFVFCYHLSVIFVKYTRGKWKQLMIMMMSVSGGLIIVKNCWMWLWKHQSMPLKTFESRRFRRGLFTLLSQYFFMLIIFKYFWPEGSEDK